MKEVRNLLLPAKFSWKGLFVMAVISAYLYVFFEWLFIITKPSFLTTASIFLKIEILLFSASLLTVICVLPLAVLFGAAALVRQENFNTLLLGLGAAVPAGAVSALALLMIDNFTYTIFKFGIVSADGLPRALYLVGFLLLFLLAFRETRKNMASIENWPLLARRPTVPLLPLAGWVLLSLVLFYQGSGIRKDDQATAALARKGGLPNILLITADGLKATHTSLYGYERNTTPNLVHLSETSLVAENYFNNAAGTTGSLLSIYTSKSSATTRVMSFPDILKGEDAYQHLPNILKRLGYYNIQYTHPVHVDAIKQNVLAGFDEINGKMVQQSGVQSMLNQYLKTDYAYFLYELGNRIVDRMRHITFNKKMITQQELVQPSEFGIEDPPKVKRILQVLEQSDRPVFTHLHWMGTHGADFYPTNRIYSQGKNIEQQQKWDRDFYDDSIVDFDAGVAKIIDALVEMGMYDNTIIIVSSDHGQNYTTTDRIPLLIHFPAGQYQREVMGNVQGLDIAPTLLEYLGIPRPAWMEGESFLTRDPDISPIIAVGVGHKKIRVGDTLVDRSDLPPFYQYGMINVVSCDTWYQLDLMDFRLETGKVPDYVGSCDAAAAVDEQGAFALMREHLAERGFDVSSLQTLPQVAKEAP